VVLVVVGPLVPVADEGHGGAGEVEGEEPAVEDDLDGVRVGDLFRPDDLVDQRGHGDRRVLPERPDHLVHLGRLEQGLIALDVDDDCVILELQRLDASAIRSVPDRWRGEVITARPPKAWTAAKIRSSSVATAAKVTLSA